MPNWELRKKRYGPTGAKNPEEYRANCSEAQQGHAPNKGFSNHKLDEVCWCGKFHGTSEKRIENLRKWRDEHGSPTEGCTYGGICRKHGVNHGPPGMLGKHHSEESRRKTSESNKITQNKPEVMEKKRQDARNQWKRPEVREKIREGQRRHKEDVVDSVEHLNQIGGFAIAVDDIRPDILWWTPWGEVRIMEVNVTHGRSLDARQKYDGMPIASSVLWVHYDRATTYWAACQNSKRPPHKFSYFNPTPIPRKFCSTECYAESMQGKEIPWQNKMLAERGLQP